jgi:hypothetical protein
MTTPISTRLYAIVVCALVLAGFHTLVGAQFAPRPPQSAPVKTRQLPMELLANRPAVRILVNKQGPFLFLIDPTRDTTLVDPSLVAELKPQPQRARGGSASRYDVSLSLGPEIVTVAVDLADTARYLPEFGPAARPRGILSISAWKDQIVTIDYTRSQITFEPGTLPEPDDMNIFALDPSRELRLTLSIGELSLLCRVDLLFPGGLLLPSSFDKQLPLSERPREYGTIQTREGSLTVREARLATTARLGSFEFKTPLVLLGGAAGIATVGSGWLSRFSITYDIARGRIRLEHR